jgi:hypothetical protein
MNRALEFSVTLAPTVTFAEALILVEVTLPVRLPEMLTAVKLPEMLVAMTLPTNVELLATTLTVLLPTLIATFDTHLSVADL